MAVYFIQQVGGVGPIKIGFTEDRNLRLRLHSLQSMCPVRLKIIKAIPGGEKTESAIHKRFKDIRLHGEWFEPTSQLLDFIASQDKVKVKLEITKLTSWTFRRLLRRQQCKGMTTCGKRCANVVHPRYENGYCHSHQAQGNGVAV